MRTDRSRPVSRSAAIAALVLFSPMVAYGPPGTAGAVPSGAATPAQSTDEREWLPLDPEYTLYIEVPAGRIVVALSEDFAPGHVDQLRTLARAHFYDGLHFYRVMEGFLAQAGDASQELPIPAESALRAEFAQPFSEDLDFVPLGEADEFGEQAGFVNGFPVRRSVEDDRIWITHCPRVFGLGRGNEPDTAAADFWIAIQGHRPNDRNDTVFGQVVWGMEHVSTMRRTGEWPSDLSDWTRIESIRVAADVEPAERTNVEVRNTSSAAFQEYLEARRNPTHPWFQHRPRAFGVCEVGDLARLSDAAG